jgi:hypothetical protein
LHESVLGSAIIFGVVTDTINIVGIIIQRPVWVMLEVVIISGLGQLAWRWYVVRHIVVPGCASKATISGLLTRSVAAVSGRLDSGFTPSAITWVANSTVDSSLGSIQKTVAAAPLQKYSPS